MWDGITYPFLNFNGCTAEVYEWISNCIPHFIIHVITYPSWDLNKSLLVKGANGVECIYSHQSVPPPYPSFRHNSKICRKVGYAGQWNRSINTIRLRRNGHYFAGIILKFIFMYHSCCSLIPVSLNVVPNGPFTICQHRFYWLDAEQTIICTNEGLVYWHIYA